MKVDEKKAFLCKISAGSMVIFSSLTPHCSGSNKTNKIRKAYLCQYSQMPIVNPFNGIQNGRAYLL